VTVVSSLKPVALPQAPPSLQVYTNSGGDGTGLNISIL